VLCCCIRESKDTECFFFLPFSPFLENTFLNLGVVYHVFGFFKHKCLYLSPKLNEETLIFLCVCEFVHKFDEKIKMYITLRIFFTTSS
jgi:hypothetical protein